MKVVATIEDIHAEIQRRIIVEPLGRWILLRVSGAHSLSHSLRRNCALDSATRRNC